MQICAKHPEKNIKFICEECKVPLCGLCSPVSFEGHIYCLECMSAIEVKREKQTERREKYSFIKSKAFRAAVVAAAVTYLIYYWLWTKPAIVTIPPDDGTRVQFYLDQALSRQKDPSAYARQLNNIFQLNPKYRHVVTYFQRGKKKLEAGQFQDALVDFGSVREMLPGWEKIYWFMSDCYIGLEDFNGAKNSLKEAVTLEPDGYESYMRLGDVYEKMENWDQAILQYNRALFNYEKENYFKPEGQKEPTEANIASKLSFLYLKAGNIAKSNEMMRKAKEAKAASDEAA